MLFVSTNRICHFYVGDQSPQVHVFFGEDDLAFFYFAEIKYVVDKIKKIISGNLQDAIADGRPAGVTVAGGTAEDKGAAAGLGQSERAAGFAAYRCQSDRLPRPAILSPTR